MDAPNPYEAPQTSLKVGTSIIVEKTQDQNPVLQRMQLGASNAFWAVLLLTVLQSMLVVFTFYGLRSIPEFLIRSLFHFAAVIWLCFGIRQMLAIHPASQARHFLQLAWIGLSLSLVMYGIFIIGLGIELPYIPWFDHRYLREFCTIGGTIAFMGGIYRIGLYYQQRAIILSAGGALLLYALTNLHYLLGCTLSKLFRNGEDHLELLQNHLDVLSKPALWGIFVIEKSLLLYALYQLLSMTADPATSSEQEIVRKKWYEDFASLRRSTKFAWGVTLSWWALVFAVIIPVGSFVLLWLIPQDRFSYSGLSIWSIRLACLCQLLGLILLRDTENAEATSWFSWALVSLAGGISFDLLPYFSEPSPDPQEQIPPAVHFAAYGLILFAPWCLLKGFHCLAFNRQEPLMQRRAAWSIFIYSVIGILLMGNYGLMIFQADFYYDLFWGKLPLIPFVSKILSIILELILVWFYAPFLVSLQQSMIAIWNQIPAAELVPVEVAGIGGEDDGPTKSL